MSLVRSTYPPLLLCTHWASPHCYFGVFFLPFFCCFFISVLSFSFPSFFNVRLFFFIFTFLYITYFFETGDIFEITILFFKFVNICFINSWTLFYEITNILMKFWSFLELQRFLNRQMFLNWQTFFQIREQILEFMNIFPNSWFCFEPPNIFDSMKFFLSCIFVCEHFTKLEEHF